MKSLLKPEQISDKDLDDFLASVPEAMQGVELIPETAENNWRKNLGLPDNFPANAL